jgi:putative flippase GtrA
VRYNLSSLGGFALSLASLGVMIHLLNIQYLLANLFAIGVATLCNYVSNVRWTWPALEAVQSETGADGG